MSFDDPVPRDDHERDAPSRVGGWRRRSALLGSATAALGLVLGCIVVLRPDQPQRASAGRATTTVKPPTTVPPIPSTTSTSISAGVAVTTTSAPAGVPGAPGRLVIGTPALDFGSTGVLRQLRLRNTGGRPVLWSATGAAGWVSVAPASGGIAGGADTLVAVRLDRGRAPEGPLATAITVTGAEGTVLVALTGAVDHPPRVTGETIDVAELYTQGGDCEPVLATVTAGVSAPDLSSVVLGWRGSDLQEHAAAMTSTGGGLWQGGLGGFSATGDIRWWVVATDAGGNRTRSVEHVLAVLDCVPS